MPGHKGLIAKNPSKTAIRSYLVKGDQVSMTIRIPETLRDAAKKKESLHGMGFNAFVRTCTIKELAKKGQ